MGEAQAGFQLLERTGRKKMFGRAADPEAGMEAQADPPLQRAINGVPEKAGNGNSRALHLGHFIRKADVPQGATLLGGHKSEYSGRRLGKRPRRAVGTVFAIFSMPLY
jgi:hypothetical protein